MATDKEMWNRRWRRLLVVILVIMAGLALRRFGYDLGLSFLVVKYGGSILWGAMVFLLIAVVSGSLRIVRMVVMALAIAAAVEFSRLYHTPELDAFRLTLAGKLLLGRVFSLWNILAYAVGIGLVAAADICLSRLTVIKVGRR
ncbi:DUF2809 domain-containing protein [Neorhizobium sp. JUb45]|uniref:ribosomal maturation YjgA family protein n=1 Tax=unclassified Neorhizobium TaxID=2629175 RepID=UPI00104FC121|nr:DUF2809 domain-containing protein [Neorhizobium sp. JUb45]TCR04720.1 uncharacterized protein DUF2809 [Neorhizobium sp. JUb45]